MQQPQKEARGSVWEILQGLLPIALVAGLARFSVAQDIFSRLSRPVIKGILCVIHVAALDNGSSITIGRLDVPWTSDCSGMNFLVLLLAVAIWMNRHQPYDLTHWMKILGMIPAAVLANVLRVFTLIGYRDIYFPQIETPQLHYFFGLFWLVPFAFLGMPRSPRRVTARVFELVHVAAVIAMLAPLTYSPDGIGLTIAVVLSLSHCRLPEAISRMRIRILGVWLLAAVALAFSGMESFWLPWLILCPLMSDAKWILTLPGVVITLSTHPLFGLIPGGSILTWGAIAFVVWNKFILSHPETPAAEPHIKWNWRERSLLVAVLVLFALPFLSSSILVGKHENLTPPKEAVLKTIPGDGFLVTMPGQSSQIGMLWYNPSGTHRHHALQMCLKYRGVDIEPTADDPDVFTDGTHWFREFFIVDRMLIASRLKYIAETAGPGKSPGVHLIYVANKSAMSAKQFDGAVKDMAGLFFGRTILEKDAKAHP